MPKIQACRNGCGVQIYTKEDSDGKWKPYDARTEQLHDCPNSPYNQQKIQGDSYRTPKTDSQLTDTEQWLKIEIQNIHKKLDAIMNGRSLTDIPEGAEPY